MTTRSRDAFDHGHSLSIRHQDPPGYAETQAIAASDSTMPHLLIVSEKRVRVRVLLHTPVGVTGTTYRKGEACARAVEEETRGEFEEDKYRGQTLGAVRGDLKEVLGIQKVEFEGRQCEWVSWFGCLFLVRLLRYPWSSCLGVH